jgi:cyclohexadieny/prephenate dehydrogenase
MQPPVKNQPAKRSDLPGLDKCGPVAFAHGVIDTLVIIAPGLLGGSVARAAHERGLVRRVVLWARRPEARLQLAEQPWVDEVAETPEAAVATADLAVLCAPVERIVELAGQVGPHLPPGSVLTDVGSVKGRLCRLVQPQVAAHASFVGSHPMAGGEKTGWQHARADLFVGRPCFVTPLPDTPEVPVVRVSRFWHGLGAEVVTLSPDEHDEIVAHVSHLPQVLATTLAGFLAGKPGRWRHLAGNGLRDTTRIAASDPDMWMEILRQNREEILRALGRTQDELHAFQSALANEDWLELRARFERAKAWRDGFRP